MTDQPASLAAALAQLQAKLPRISKDKTARVTSQRTGKTHTYDYVNLATISAKIYPLMAPLGLAFTAAPTTTPADDGHRFVLAYNLLHVSGEKIEGAYPLPSGGTPQEIGSAITYARRYCLCAVTGVAPDDDDDDANASQTATSSSRGRPPQRAAGNLPRNDDGSIKRSRVTDDELNAAGAMTDAQQRGHNKLERDVLGVNSKGQLVEDSGSERLPETPPDDPWLDNAPPLRTPRAAPPKAGVIHQHFKRLGFDDDEREQRLAAMSAMTGRRITSTNDLTAAEGIEVGRVLQQFRNGDRGALIEYLAVKAGEDIA